MIVSHEHKFIFLKPRKVAGTSFEIALSRYLSRGDIITPLSKKDEAIRTKLGFEGAQNFAFGFARLFTRDINEPVKIFGQELPLKYYNHLPASRAKVLLPGAVWRDYRKISLVRNPWERAVSIFFWKNTKRDRKPDLANFTRYFKDNAWLLEINYPIYRVGGQDIIDTYLRYEHFEDDIKALEADMPVLSGLWDTFKDINAKGGTRDRSQTTRDIFNANPEVDAMIRKANQWEIERFGYRLD